MQVEEASSRRLPGALQLRSSSVTGRKGGAGVNLGCILVEVNVRRAYNSRHVGHGVSGRDLGNISVLLLPKNLLLLPSPRQPRSLGVSPGPARLASPGTAGSGSSRNPRRPRRSRVSRL
eukprot:764665-Hanusia_phi.AAC.2